ncbi:MAG: tRNA epoxyqueuosine(34) reductase QueG, partial [Acidobacteria bacterium]|nr:tRNA epoxyqueuosine(34) reductase QueG [Acidobacteriota bacterium]
MDLRRRTRRVRELVAEEAFDAVGIARLAPAATGASFRRWLGRGDQAAMAWLERRVERRLDPRQVLPGARSAVVVGWRYAPLENAGDVEPTELWRRVARYARGADYHDFLLERLERTGERLAAEFPEVEHRAYVDTGAILERELAVRAGVGAIGKNTCLLSPEQGSWLLLGELLLTLDLEPDPPVADLCGDCSLCLEACPTGALSEPFRLDSTRCISYWTIEHRGEIPLELRAAVGEWVFGC